MATRRLWGIGVLVLAAIALVLFSQSLLRALGWALVAEDPLQRADAIVISVDAGPAGILEAADLLEAHIADHVALFEEQPSRALTELRRRGIPVRDPASIALERLRQLGATSSEVIVPLVAGTEDEGRILPLWCEQHGVHRVVFVSARDHTRRTRHVLGKALRARHITLIERAARYSSFDPDNWWRTRNGARIEIIELQKLVWELL
jgi:hypothetical protein